MLEVFFLNITHAYLVEPIKYPAFALFQSWPRAANFKISLLYYARLVLVQNYNMHSHFQEVRQLSRKTLVKTCSCLRQMKTTFLFLLLKHSQNKTLKRQKDSTCHRAPVTVKSYIILMAVS